ncbi:MAG: type II secretion system minor pseudopilin GspK, partial [Gammaproteobacteria bacterium]|nr:type II secretion system minor pseudopilin GspK [Gammaproteobacteria bacterium]
MKARYSRRQKGIALITALLIVALATISAAAMVSRQQIDIRRTSNVLNLDQAYLYALGAEEWARRILIRDRNNSKIDHLSEDWAIRLPPTMVEGGGVSGHLQDLQGRFNLNNLVENGKAVPAEIKRFQRLLAALDLPVELAQAVTDWIDADS